MIYITEKIENTGACFEGYIHHDHRELAYGKRDCIIVCPGGGYSFLSEREAEPVALQYFAAGLNVFILRYSVGANSGNFNPLTEGLLLIRHVRENADKYCINKNRVFITGFSAGAHVAASCGVHYGTHTDLLDERLGAEREIYRPDGMILCYPVLTGGEKAHRGSIDNVTGGDERLIPFFTLEDHVTSSTPPAFIWHTASDGLVPVENSLLFASALVRCKVGCELHIYPAGPHGLSLCNKETWSNYEGLVVPYVEGWMELSINWIRKYPEFLK